MLDHVPFEPGLVTKDNDLFVVQHECAAYLAESLLRVSKGVDLTKPMSHRLILSRCSVTRRFPNGNE